MITISCGVENQQTKIEIYDEKLVIKGNVESIIPFYDVKSVNIKNSEVFLLKINLESTFSIFEFENLHLRDLIKSIVLDKIKTAESVQKNVILTNIDYLKTYKNIKNLVGDKQFVDSVDSHSSVYFQKSTQEITPENFFKILNQPLVDVFIMMNCTITQFFNLLISSYFYNIKNQKNAFDRLIFSKLRDFNSGMDYASRINSYSLFNMAEGVTSTFDQKPVKSKQVEFEPLCPFEVTKSEYANKYNFVLSKLKANIEVIIQPEEQTLVFDFQDFETARDLCKLMYRSPNKECIKFSEDFINVLMGKYGKKILKYVNRLVPTYYNKSTEMSN